MRCFLLVVVVVALLLLPQLADAQEGDVDDFIARVFPAAAPPSSSPSLAELERMAGTQLDRERVDSRGRTRSRPGDQLRLSASSMDERWSKNNGLLRQPWNPPSFPDDQDSSKREPTPDERDLILRQAVLERSLARGGSAFLNTELVQCLSMSTVSNPNCSLILLGSVSGNTVQNVCAKFNEVNNGMCDQFRLWSGRVWFRAIKVTEDFNRHYWNHLTPIRLRSFYALFPERIRYSGAFDSLSFFNDPIRVFPSDRLTTYHPPVRLFLITTTSFAALLLASLTILVLGAVWRVWVSLPHLFLCVAAVLSGIVTFLYAMFLSTGFQGVGFSDAVPNISEVTVFVMFKVGSVCILALAGLFIGLIGELVLETFFTPRPILVRVTVGVIVGVAGLYGVVMAVLAEVLLTTFVVDFSPLVVPLCEAVLFGVCLCLLGVTFRKLAASTKSENSMDRERRRSVLIFVVSTAVLLALSCAEAVLAAVYLFFKEDSFLALQVVHHTLHFCVIGLVVAFLAAFLRGSRKASSSARAGYRPLLHYDSSSTNDDGTSAIPAVYRDL